MEDRNESSEHSEVSFVVYNSISYCLFCLFMHLLICRSIFSFVDSIIFLLGLYVPGTVLNDGNKIITVEFSLVRETHEDR